MQLGHIAVIEPYLIAPVHLLDGHFIGVAVDRNLVVASLGYADVATIAVVEGNHAVNHTELLALTGIVDNLERPACSKIADPFQDVE